MPVNSVVLGPPIFPSIRGGLFKELLAFVLMPHRDERAM